MIIQLMQFSLSRRNNASLCLPRERELPINRCPGRLHNKRARDRDGCERGTKAHKSVINSDPKNVRSLVRNGVKMGLDLRDLGIYNSRCNDTTRLLSMPIYDFFFQIIYASLPLRQSEISILSGPRILKLQ